MMKTATEIYDAIINRCESNGMDDMAQALESIGLAMNNATIILDMHEEDQGGEHKYKPSDVIALAKIIINEAHRNRTEIVDE